MNRPDSRNLLALGGFIVFSLLLWMSKSIIPHHANTEPKDTLAVQTRVEAVYATQTLVDFCKSHPERVGAIKSREDLLGLLENVAIPRDSWIGLSMTEHLNTGDDHRRGSVYRVFDSGEGFDFVRCSLLVLAGTPPVNSRIDYLHAQAIQMSDQTASGDPFETLQDLMELNGRKATDREKSQ